MNSAYASTKEESVSVDMREKERLGEVPDMGTLRGYNRQFSLLFIDNRKKKIKKKYF